MKKFCIGILVVLIALIFIPTFQGVAFADTKSGSNVLDDLSQDTTFDKSLYPSSESDNSISIITLAESSDKELLVYIYQPNVSKDYRCSSINISTEINDSLKVNNFVLEYLNSSDTLYKYRVKDFTVSSDNIRYYVIPQIMRPYDSSVDTAPEGNNTISEVPFAVGKQWAFYELNGKSCVECVEVETIHVTEKMVGFIRYYNGGIFHGVNYPANTDAHFVAFSTDREIDKLIEVDIQYKTASVLDFYDTYSSTLLSRDIGDSVLQDVQTIRHTMVESESNKIFAHKYSFDRIQTAADLIAEHGVMNLVYSGALVDVSAGTQLSQSLLQSLESKQWVLRFLETNVGVSSGQAEGTIYRNYTMVSDVILLRMQFETNGKVYNLGVVDNKQTGDINPAGESNIVVELSDEFNNLIRILCLIVAILILCALFPYILKVLGFIVKVITAPFRWLFGSRKSNNGKVNKRR